MHMSVLLCYAPTTTPRSVDASERFYLQLAGLMAALPLRIVVVLMDNGRFDHYQPQSAVPDANGQRVLLAAALIASRRCAAQAGAVALAGRARSRRGV
jgi:hypothetical protein